MPEQTYDYLIAPKASFDATADAIRAVNGTNSAITWGQDGFASAIGSSRKYTLRDIASSDVISGALALDLTGITNIKNRTFAYYPNITSVHLIMDRMMASYMFADCTSLTTIVSINTTTTGVGNTNICNGCSNLTVADYTISYSFANSSFNGTKLQTLILRRSDGITPISSGSAFNGSPFASGGTGGTIYIPKVLYDHLGDGTANDYKSATNWSTLDGYGTITWAKIEGSQYENYYADGTPIPTT